MSEETKQADNKDEKVDSLITKVREYMCVGEGYTLTPVDYLVMSGLMEVIKMSAAVVVAPLVNGGALLCSYMAFKAALATKHKRLMFIALLFFAFDLYSLLTQKGYVE